MDPKPLPIGIQTFRKIIESGRLYVDKTRHLYPLLKQGGGVYFLSRPRRFGKSTLLSTFEEIFLGHRELFQGLWIDHADYDWKSFPIIRLDLNDYNPERPLSDFLLRLLHKQASSSGLHLPDDLNYSEAFYELIERTYLQSEGSTPVVVLIDEYDKPLISTLSDKNLATLNQKTLKHFYSVLKSSDRYLHFVFLTGVSKFSQVGVFSGLNHLDDLSWMDSYANLLGWDQEELETNFQFYLQQLAQAHQMSLEQTLEKIRIQYNGYRFSKRECYVYNPFSTMLALHHQSFEDYWFQSGTPTFLIDLIRRRNFDLPKMEGLMLRAKSFSAYDVDKLQLPPLLFQTGYLTIRNYQPDRDTYTLGYPNREVRNGFNEQLLDSFLEAETEIGESLLNEMWNALLDHDFPVFFDVLHTLLAKIPYNIQIAQESYYQSIFYLIFSLLGVDIQAEVTTNRGRIDAVIETDDSVFLFEFKLNNRAETALQQIEERGYGEKYRRSGKQVVCIGMNFEEATRNVGEYQVNQLS